MSHSPLDSAQLRQLLQELSDGLARRGAHAQLFVVGGAAMALEYDADRVTRDMDAVFTSATEVRELAAGIAQTHGLEPDWLNDAAKGFMPPVDADPRTVFSSEYLLVQVPSPKYLLAMKLHAARDERDLNDAALLYNVAGMTTAKQGRDLLGSVYSPAQLLPRHQYLVEEVAQRAAALRVRTVGAACFPHPPRAADRTHNPQGSVTRQVDRRPASDLDNGR